jgi:hypothetical protein
MDLLCILAEAAGTARTNADFSPLAYVDILWEYATSLNLVEALTFISFGVVCLFYGWRIFKILVCICFGLGGLFVGVWINDRLIQGNAIWLSIISTIIFSFFALPLMSWGVSLLGGAAGGLLSGGAWLALGLPRDMFWAGGLVGFVAGAMLSFIVFKGAVMLFTSLGGSVLIVTGLLAICYNNSPEKVQALAFGERWFVPTLLTIPMIAGIVLQYKLLQGAKDWSLEKPSGKISF